MKRCAWQSEWWISLALLAGCVEEPSGPSSLGPSLEVRETGVPVRVGQEGTQGAYEFGRIRDATRLSDGRIAVADRMNATVHVFDSVGQPIDKWGRPGKGPGEFDILFGLAAGPSGELLAWDSRLQRSTVFDEAGQVIDDASTRWNQLLGYRLEAWDASSERLVFSRRSTLPPQGERRGTGEIKVALGEPSDASSEVVLNLDYVESARIQGLPGGRVVRVPLAPVALLAATESTIYYTDSKGGVIRIFELDGGERETVELDLPLREPSEEEIRSWEESVHRLYGDAPGAEEYIRVVRSEVGIAKQVSPLTRIRTDGWGNAWFKLRGEPRWVGVGPDGSVLGQIELPPVGTVLEIGVGYVLFISFDSLDRSTIELRRLSWN